MALEAIVNREGVYRVVLEEYVEGVYVLVYDTPELSNDSPCQDHLQNDWKMAKLAALQDYGVTEEMWREIPNTGIMG